MKAGLYGVYEHRMWRWLVTLDPAVDRYYWHRYRGVERIYWLDQALPFGQAAAAAERLNAQPPELRRDEGHKSDKLLHVLSRRFRRKLKLEEQSFVQIDDQASVIDEAEAVIACLLGRSLVPEEIIKCIQFDGHEQAASRWKSYVQAAYLFSGVQLVSAVSFRKDKIGLWGMGSRKAWRCRRCGSDEHLRWSDCDACGEKCPYCENCVQMGRARYCTPLVVGSADDLPEEQTKPLLLGSRQQPDTPEEQADIDRWKSVLSPAQWRAAASALDFLRRGEKTGSRTDIPGSFLLWAVTGAGKTEMLFPLIAYALKLGKSLLIATPRKDVVLELLPRVQSAFPACTVSAQFGGSEQVWERGHIHLATTHQLLRFQSCFDIVVIDEIDAFPYHNNPMLQFAARKACRRHGRFLLLSATPPRSLLREVKRGKVEMAVVPVRFHGHPLPVPLRLSTPPLSKQVRSINRPLHAAIVKSVRSSLQRGGQLFVFVPKIAFLSHVEAQLMRSFSDVSIAATSSEDPQRIEKVSAFRSARIRILVTTTILERGVTIPKADVVILDADDPLFDEAALIQMAGRAGRSAADPNGRVTFFSSERTGEQARAIRRIRELNRKGVRMMKQEFDT